jgi:hypothetical protein
MLEAARGNATLSVVPRTPDHRILRDVTCRWYVVQEAPTTTIQPDLEHARSQRSAKARDAFDTRLLLPASFIERVRNSTSAPYVSHLMSVDAWVLDNGGDEGRGHRSVESRARVGMDACHAQHTVVPTTYGPPVPA